MSIFVNAMRIVGDLDDEFYRDERQRDVWNEASAVGFQLFLWSALLAGAVLPWVAGTVGAWIAVGVLAVAMAISWATIGYANHRDVDLHAAATLSRPRLVFVLGLYAVGIVGIVARLVAPESESPVSTWSGAAVGTAIGVVVAAFGVRARRRRQARFEAEEI